MTLFHETSRLGGISGLCTIKVGDQDVIGETAYRISAARSGIAAGCHAGGRPDFRIEGSRSASRRTARSTGRSAISFCNSMAA